MSGQERLELIELTGGSDLFWAPCRLRRSKKARRVSARVLMGGEIELVLPVKHSEKEGLAFLQKQGKWLERQLSKSLAPVSLLEHLRKKPLLTIDGKKRQTTVEFACQKSSPSWRRSEDGCVEFALDPAQDPERQAVLLAKSLAKTYLPVRVANLGERIGLSPKQVRVGDQRSRWGSCSSRRILSLNWRLLLLDPDLQDYVVHHELAHLKIMNHSENYWKFLSTLTSKAVEQDRRLTKLSSQLMNVGRLATC
ncbi:MAG: hypothetical protein CMI32_02505 [Opitutales bacterium]|nr:hypothetical protein [Opitutales bacterium]